MCKRVLSYLRVESLKQLFKTDNRDINFFLRGQHL